MWVPRTPQEVGNWHKATKREARWHGILIAGLVWVAISVFLGGGWVAGGRTLFVAQESVAGGSFWSRVPIFALVGLPFAIWLFRHESKKELVRASQMTICPICDTAGEGNAGNACECGGMFVLQSTVRWLDEEATPPPSESG